MAKHKRMLSDYDMEGLSGKPKRKRKKAKKASGKVGAKLGKVKLVGKLKSFIGMKVVTNGSCTVKSGKKKGKLKKGCRAGIGKLKGKFFRKAK